MQAMWHCSGVAVASASRCSPVPPASQKGESAFLRIAIQLHLYKRRIQAGSRTGLRHLYGACSQKVITEASQLPPPRRVEKENLAAFIAKKREIFMVQMSLDIKKQEMRRLAQRAAQVTPSSVPYNRKAQTKKREI